MIGPMYEPVRGRGGPIAISTVSYEALGTSVSAMRPPIANLAWPLASVAIFVPFILPEPCTVTKLWWINNTVPSPAPNVDVGIYDADGNRLVSSGSTAQFTVQNVQSVDVADTRLDRQKTYYLAMSVDVITAGTGFVFANLAAGLCQALGMVRQTSGFPLPLTATYAVTTHAGVPIMGAQAYRAIGP